MVLEFMMWISLKFIEIGYLFVYAGIRTLEVIKREE